ncbi:hypothetical protein T492DRAFT_632517 [Pavlovales sp. CCMP2436]|nr:hypothetical protein T492DRAFT_632517 [Pavlovales sp. CCMP2436]
MARRPGAAGPGGRLLLTAWCCTLQRLAGWASAATHRPFTAAPRLHATARALATAHSSVADDGFAAGFVAALTGPEARSTIFAVSSGAGVRSGVAVIRVSGPDARLSLERMTARGRREPSLGWLQPRMATLLKLLSPDSDEKLDSALVLWFPAPRSFTGEDVAELHVHGGRAVIASVLGALGSLPGHRLAERGEYTRRAYLNGRMDLTEVEGLSDLLAANTDAQRRQALAQMGGHARTTFDGWRARLLDCLAHTEAVIDFGEDSDDLGGDVLAAVSRQARTFLNISFSHNVPRLAARRRTGMTCSSLLNRLAQRPAAIVTPIAGTTRDVLEVQLELSGLPLRVYDTAGLRDEAQADVIEAEGMRRARALVKEAPMRLLVADVSAGQVPSLAGLLNLISGDKIAAAAALEATDANAGGEGDPLDGALLVLNKIDALPPGTSPPRVSGVPFENQFAISCETGQGLDTLLAALEARVRALVEGEGAGETALVTRARHREHLEQAVGALERFARLDGVMVDLAAEELRIAAQEVGKVTGRVHVEEMLDIIFRDFCIGK